MPETHNNNTELEQRLDALGRGSRDAAAPAEPPASFLDAVRSARRPVLIRLRLAAGLLAAAASIALVVWLLLPASGPGGDDIEINIAQAPEPAGLNPLSAASLRLRNAGRPLDDLDLPDASIVHWVSEASPF